LPVTSLNVGEQRVVKVQTYSRVLIRAVKLMRRINALNS